MKGRKRNKVLTSNALEKRINDAKMTDKRIKYCNNCNKCWEHFIDEGSPRIYHYEDFPSYGKQIKMCKRCKLRGEINEQNVMDKLSM